MANKETDEPVDKGQVAYVLDDNTLNRIDRLVNRYRKEFASQGVLSQAGGGSSVGPFENASKLVPRLFDEEADKPVSDFVKQRLNDPANMVAMISGETAGISAIRRVQALLKLYNDHVTEKLPLPSGMNLQFIIRKIRYLMKQYGREMARNISSVQKMDRETAVSIIQNTLNDNFRAGGLRADNNAQRVEDAVNRNTRYNDFNLKHLVNEVNLNGANNEQLLLSILKAQGATTDSLDELAASFSDGEVSFSVPKGAYASPAYYSTPKQALTFDDPVNQGGKGMGKKQHYFPRFTRRWVAISC